MRPKLTAWLDTVLLNSSTVLATPLSSLLTLCMARCSSMLDVESVIVAISTARMTPARANVTTLMRVPTFQLAKLYFWLLMIVEG